MNKIRPTIVAMMVSAAIAGTSTNANAIELRSLPNFDASSAPKKLVLDNRNEQKRLAEKETRSGMKSIFDARIGKATFLWAEKKQAKPVLSMVLPEKRTEYAASFYLNALTGFSSNETAQNKANLAYIHDINKGGIIAKYRQELQGVEVFNREFNVMMDREYNLVAGSGYFSMPTPANKMIELFANFGTAENAVLRAIDDLSRGQTRAVLTPSIEKGKYQWFEADTTEGLRVVGNPRAKRVFFEDNGKLIPAHYVEVRLAEMESLDSHDYSYVISRDGRVLFRKNLVSHSHEFTYRTFAEANGFPYEGPHGDVIPQAMPGIDPTAIVDMPLVTIANFEKISTDDPWLSEDSTTTAGNNVFAYADVVAPQGFTNGDIVASVTSDKTFDYPFMTDQTSNSFANRQAAVVNMFVMNNFLHDWWYDFGFDEASGNAQESNYGRGGEEGDPLHAQAQDYSGLNNANMSTPADGDSPRMQQYLYTSKDAQNGVDLGLTITSHESLGLLSSTRTSAFGPSQYAPFEGAVVRLQNSITDTSSSEFDGCEPAVNPEAIAGNIAIIDRGACTFASKVLNAQEAGAIGAIIVNNVDDGTPAPMGGGDPNVTIPNMGVNFEEGHGIYNLLAAEETVTAEMFSNFPLKDSSFDNGIIAHEWGHYIQNRLVGNTSGLINFQGRNMGEGWSDFHSLMFIVKEEDGDIPGNEEWALPFATGTYVEDFFFGIRRAPYSTNMDINPLTFQHITSGAVPPGLPPTNGESPHAAGEMWAAVLWDLYAKLLNTYEFSEAQSRMASYLVAGYKMTPVAPTYVEARDAILSAMYANDVADYEAAVEVFARRGLGFGAVAPDRFSNDNAGVIESYETQLATYSAGNLQLNENYDGPDLGYCTADNILDAGETGALSFSITNSGSEVLTDVTAQIVVLSDHDVTLENDGLVTFSEIPLLETVDSGQIAVTLNTAGTADLLQLGVVFPEADDGDDIVEPVGLEITTTVNFAFEKQPLEGNTATADMETLAMFADFELNVMSGWELAEETQTFDTVNTGFFQSFNPGVDLGQQTMFLVNNAFQSDVAVETDMVEVDFGGNFAISFWHFYWLEENWDGGVVEVSINGGDWVDVTEAGGVFDVGYNLNALNENPSQALQNRPVFSGINGDFATHMGNLETIRFGSALDGQAVRFRFRISSDALFSEFGWHIDNVTFTNIVTDVFNVTVAGDSVEACDNVAPKVTLSETEVSVNEGVATSITATATDRNVGDTLSYSWEQTSGTAATMTGVDTATMTFTANVSADEELTFAVTVSDGSASTTSSITANVTDVPPPAPAPVPEPVNRSSGGSTGWLALLLFPLAWIRRHVKQ